MGAPPPIIVELTPLDPRYLNSCPLAAVDVSVQVTGLVAEYTLRQRYLNLAPEAIEAVVRVPLPEGAVVRSLVLRQAGRVIEASVREKAQAQELYAQARATGQRAALAEEARDNLMLLRVNAITPGVPLEVEVRIAAHLAFEAGEATLAFPLTMTPRYLAPNTPPEDARRISPPFTKGERLYGVSFLLELNAGAPLLSIDSDSHLISWHKVDAQHAVATLKEGEVMPDRDILLRWQMQSAIDQPQLESARVEANDAAVVMLSLPPPAEARDEEILPRHVTFLLDRSGSMAGEPMNSAKRALQGFLRSLGGRDVFSIVAFDDQQVTLPPQPFSDASLQSADAFLANIDANGGTEILPALQVALFAEVPAGYLRTVVLLTDGSVSNEDAVALAVQHASRSKGLRAHGIGLGGSVNRSLVSKFARAGRGLCEFVPSAAALAPMLARFQARSGAPLATEISLEFEGAPIIDLTPQLIGDLDLGQPILLFGRALESGAATLILRARLSGSLLERRYSFDIPAGAHGNPALVSLWARARINDLQEEGAKHRDEILRLSLKHKILTSYTSLIAIDRQDPGTGKTPETIEVPAHTPALNLMEPSLGSRSMMSMPAPMAQMPSLKQARPTAPSASIKTMLAPKEPEDLESGETLFGMDGAGIADADLLAKLSAPTPPSMPALVMREAALPIPDLADQKMTRAYSLAPEAEPEQKPGFFARLFGKAKPREENKPIVETRAKRAAPPAQNAAPPAPQPAPIAPPAVRSPSPASPPRIAAPAIKAVPSRERVEAALRFLARQQSASGAFGDASLTSLIVEAFAAAGETAKKGLYRRQLGRAEAFLASAAVNPPGHATPDLTQLLAAQRLGGDQDGAVVGVGETLLMTALLVKLLCAAGL